MNKLQILEESKKYYDFDDVMIKPRLSYLNSRAQVNLEKTFYFNNKLAIKG